MSESYLPWCCLQMMEYLISTKVCFSPAEKQLNSVKRSRRVDTHYKTFITIDIVLLFSNMSYVFFIFADIL